MVYTEEEYQLIRAVNVWYVNHRTKKGKKKHANQTSASSALVAVTR